MRIFRDRHEAGRLLAERLTAWKDRPDVVVAGLTRGGVPVAAEVAGRLRAPLEAFVVRKLGVPGREELAFGAIASGGVRVLNEDVVALIGVSPATIAEIECREREELKRRERRLRGTEEPPHFRGRRVILVDDGLATGASMKAAIDATRALGAIEVVVAVPVGAAETCREIVGRADHVECLHAAESFDAVGYWYQDFSQTSDEEVRRLLDEGAAAA